MTTALADSTEWPPGGTLHTLRALFPHVEQPPWCEQCEIEVDYPGVVDHYGPHVSYETNSFLAGASVSMSTGRSIGHAQPMVSFTTSYNGSTTDAWLTVVQFRQLVAEYNALLARFDAQGAVT